MKADALKLGKIVLTIVSFALLSWLLIHLLAVFGVFVFVAYPIWHFFAPQKTLCFICLSRKNNDFCPFCLQRINKEEGTYPKSFRSAVLNACLILAFTIISFGFVFLESRVLFKLGFPPTPKTVSFVIPSRGSYRIGEIFTMEIEIVGIKTPINAVQTDLAFNPERLEVVDILTADSFANIFIQKEINNGVGYTRLSGGVPNPGFLGDTGVFGTVLFKGKSPGVVQVEFLPSSLVLANDGRGTNVLKELAKASYLILPERISEEEAKLQEKLTKETVVLGEKDEQTQMRFYDEKRVLGAQTQIEKEIQKQQQFSLSRILLDSLEKFDRTVLEIWARPFAFLREIMAK